MNIQETEQLLNLIPTIWSSFPKSDSNTVAVWASLLADQPHEDVMLATKHFAVQDSPFAPTPGQLIGRIENAGEDQWEDEWPDVARLISGGALRGALDPADFPTDRSYRACKGAMFELLNARADKVRWVFRDAWRHVGEGSAVAAIEGPSCTKLVDCPGLCRGHGVWLDHRNRLHQCDGTEFVPAEPEFEPDSEIVRAAQYITKSVR